MKRFVVHCKVFELKGSEKELVDNFKTSPEELVKLLRVKYLSRPRLFEAILRDWDLSAQQIDEVVLRVKQKR